MYFVTIVVGIDSGEPARKSESAQIALAALGTVSSAQKYNGKENHAVSKVAVSACCRVWNTNQVSGNEY